MERLTKWVDNGDEKFAIINPFIRSNGHTKCLTKLAEYEDLNVSPEEMRKIYSEWLDYKKQEKDERLFKLPCKIGDTIYSIYDGEIYESKIQRINIIGKEAPYLWFKWDLTCARWQDKYGFAEREIGKIVFLTYAEAEEKLNEREEKFYGEK